MRLISLLIQIVIGCCGCWSSAATMKCGKINGAAAKTRHFPREITFKLIDNDQAKASFLPPKTLKVTVGKVRISSGKILISALVSSSSRRPFSLVVNPYGGSFPYGGDNPFSLRLSAAAREVVKYSGELFPPEPPRPMLIQLPASSCTQFEAQIDLSNYTYRGAPRVTLEWNFYYFDGKHPQGTVEVQLPPR